MEMCILVPQETYPAPLISVFGQGILSSIVVSCHRLHMVRRDLPPELDTQESNKTFRAL